MVDNKQGIGLEKAQGEGIQQSKKVMASKEKIVVPENIQCDSSESGNGSLQDKEKDAPVVNGGSQVDDKLQFDDSSDSKSGSGDDSAGSKSGFKSGSKSGSGDDSSNSQSSSAKEVLEEVKKQEKKKGLIEKIRDILGRKPKEPSAEVANEEIPETKEEEKQNFDKLQYDTSDSGSGSSSASNKKKKVIGKKIKKKKKVTKKNEGEASNPEKLQCTSSTGEDAGSKSGSGDDSSKSKAGSGDDSGSKSDPPPTKNGSLKVQKKKDKESSKIVTEEDMSKLGGHSPNNSGDSGSESQSDSASSPKKKRSLIKKRGKELSKMVNEEDIKKLGVQSPNNSGDSGSDTQADSGSSGDEVKPKVNGRSREQNKDLKLKIKEKSTGKTGEEPNQTAVTEHQVSLSDTKVDKTVAVESSQTAKDKEKDEDMGGKVTAHEADKQGTKDKKSMFGKIIEKLPGYNRNVGE